MNDMGEKDASQLFLVRLWLDAKEGEGKSDGHTSGSVCHGKVQHVLSGKAAPFSDWETLMEQLSSMMPRPTGEGAEGSTDEDIK